MEDRPINTEPGGQDAGVSGDIDLRDEPSPEVHPDANVETDVPAAQPKTESVRPEESAAAKSSVLNRVIARFIDILVALLLGRLPGLIGFFAALTYIGIADGLMGGRSIGKRIIGLRVTNPGRGRAADFRDSILRNSTVGLMYIISRIPILGHIAAAVGLGMELVLIVGSPEGKRLGDEIAGTVVSDHRQDYAGPA